LCKVFITPKKKGSLFTETLFNSSGEHKFRKCSTRQLKLFRNKETLKEERPAI
jgi:hypothetical protein